MSSPERQGWFSRNWKWFLPVGCLSMIVIVVGVVAAFVFFIFGAMKSSDVFQQAMAKTRSNAAVVSELGEPIESGWLFSGSIKVNNSSGSADLAIPVSGPKKSGTLYVVAAKKLGKWNFSALEVEIKGENKRIDLLSPPVSPPGEQ